MNTLKPQFTGIFVAMFILTLVALKTPATSANGGVPSAPPTCLSKRHARWIENGVAHSRAGHLVLIVNKAAHTMVLYEKGKKAKTYPVELGMETHKKGGWRPTPLGNFELRYKAVTQYHKALLFEMPGYYEIHGEGSGLGRDGTDWTFGCIALSNSDMDDLFRRIGIEKQGMPVGQRARRRILKNARLVIAPSGLNAQTCD